MNSIEPNETNLELEQKKPVLDPEFEPRAQNQENIHGMASVIAMTLDQFSDSICA